MQWNDLINRIFYTAKPMIPRSVQLAIRRQIVRHKRSKKGYHWPIDPHSSKAPAGWQGWPDGKRFALVLSHDVDTRKGYENALKLADLEEQMGFRSSFNFVPERYGEISLDLVEQLKRRGFGVAVHGLKHDGKLFSSRKKFDERAPRINAYLKGWATRGFTAPSMICNHDWMHQLEIDYSTSTFDTDPFEPQPGGAGTIFPYWVRNGSPGKGFLELPYTLAQDFTLFVILGEKNIGIWRKKLDWISDNGGMALLNTHPDYMNFNDANPGSEEYPVRYYMEFLEYVKSRYGNHYWPALPRDVWLFCLDRLHSGGNTGS